MLRKRNRNRTRSQTRRDSACNQFEQLETRKLFAADLGLAIDAPVLEPVDIVEVGQFDTAQRSSNAAGNASSFANSSGVELDLDEQSGVLTINGTNQNDRVTVAYQGSLVLVQAETTNAAGDVVATTAGVYFQDQLQVIYFDALAGADFFSNATWENTIVDGGFGDDVMFGGYGTNHFSGGSGNDYMIGGFQRDYIYGGSGNDIIGGHYGDDYLDGGLNNDQIWGSYGDDTIVGGSGNDRIWGESGDDYIDGDSGDDQLRGGSGNDTILGGIGNDDIWGQSGNDTLKGESGADEIWGGTGNDKLYGNGGLDYLYGEAGNDRLDGGNDGIRDHVFGGIGADTFVRHKHIWGDDDPDWFRDYFKSEGDKIDNDWHW